MDDGFYVKAVEDRKAELLQSKWATKVLDEVKSVGTHTNLIRCLALGQISEFVNPRFQTALLLLIAETLQVSTITAWDPAFSDTDKRVLEHFGVTVTIEDPDPTESVMWYVPHGPFSLVTQLPTKIGRGVYIGNDLSKFERTQASEALLNYRENSRIVSIDPGSKERWYTAFNVTAVHSRS